MQQIADWLKMLGMSKYAERFAENGIDVSVLRHLTDQDLKDIGVLLGHRRKMLAALAELRGAVPATPQPTFTEQKTQDTAERREASADTKASLDQAGLSIEQAHAVGEPLEDPLRLFSALYGFWVANLVASNGDVVLKLAAQFLALAENQGATVPLMIGHRIIGMCLLITGDIAEGRAHLDRAIALYDPAEHRQLATRFAVDAGATILSYRSLARWFLGCPEAALVDADHALSDARETGHVATLILVLGLGSITHIHCGNYATANALVDELVALADEKGRSSLWKAAGMLLQGQLFALTGKAFDAVRMITSGLAAMRSTGATLQMPRYLTNLARAYAELGHFDDAWRFIGEAMTAVETTKERWWEAEINRTAGEIALMSSERDAAKAEAYFERALAVAREQQAKSWELRAAMSMARLWRDQGKPQQARDLLSPVYGWFTEGFDTLDLKEAKALLDELRA
jgi:predicted ATPase